MAVNWKKSLTTLGLHIQTQKGYAFKSKWYADNGRPIVKVSNFTDDSVDTSDLVCIPEEIAKSYLKYELLTGDVIIQTVGSWPSSPMSVVGKTIRIPLSATGVLLNQNAVKLIPAKELDLSYLFYLLRNETFKSYIIGTAQGAASQASITLDSIKRFSFALPPFSYQRKVASILSTYDNLIENNQRRILILEEMAQIIYREWFINFRFPGHDMVRMVDSQLGEIPEGWEARKLGDEIELAYGKGLKATDRVPGEVPVYGSSGVVGYHNVSLVKGPGIIVGRKGNVGSVHWSDIDFHPIDTVFYVKTDLPLHYVFYNLQTQNFISSDAAVPGLKRDQAYALPILIPSSTTAHDFSTFVLPVFSLIKNLKERSANLRRTRDLLLPKLISGELDVSDLDLNIGEVAA